MIAPKTKSRTCGKCKKSFPATGEYFHYRHDTSRLDYRCKACRSEQSKQRYSVKNAGFVPFLIPRTKPRGKLCGNPECSNKVVKHHRGWCRACYTRLRRTGSVERTRPVSGKPKGTKEGPNESSANPLPTLDQARQNYENACTVAARMQWRATIRALEELNGKT